MTELPKRFPEYSLMYKTILKRIKEVEEGNNQDIVDKESKIKEYQRELEKIRSMFPDKFFDDYS